MSTRKQKPMTITVALTVILPDPQQWTTTFGVETRREIREDVKEYVLNEAQHAGVFGNGEIQAEISLKRR